jgi:hypothetical protein
MVRVVNNWERISISEKEIQLIKVYNHRQMKEGG